MAPTIKERAEAFITEYGALVMKHNLDFAHYPVFIPDELGNFKITVHSTPVDVTPVVKE